MDGMMLEHTSSIGFVIIRTHVRLRERSRLFHLHNVINPLIKKMIHVEH
jgi:hypothetical protein